MAEWKAPSEALNHAPTELCPHPEYWTAWNPVSTEVEVSKLVAAFVTAMQPDYVVEIGSHYGQTTERICNALMDNGHGKLTALEIREDFTGSTMQRCGGTPPEYFEMVTADSLQYIPEHPIDILFVDGDEANRAKDVKHYTPYLSPHAIVICHDMSYYTEERDKIIEAWEGDHITLYTPRGLLILTR